MSNSKSENKSELDINQRYNKQSLLFNTLPIAFYNIAVSGDFKLTYISNGVKDLTGYDSFHFESGSRFWESRLHPDDKELAKRTVENVINRKSYDIEYRWKCADGEYKWFYDHGEVIYDYQGRAKEIVGSWINITDRKVTEQSINLLIEKTTAVTGTDFFRNLVKNIAKILGVRFAFVAKCTNTEKTRVRTIAFWSSDDFAENFEYDLDGTPCKNVIAGEFSCYEDNVIELFPDARELSSLNVKGFLGIPIYNSRNSVIGHLAILDNNSLKDFTQYYSILRVFALRAGVEMERLDSEESLRRSHDQLEIAYEQIKDLKSKLEKENIYLKEEIKTEHNFYEIVAMSREMKEVLAKVDKVSNTDTTIIIRGETGTGKELISRLIHNTSNRNSKPLIKVNCPAIPSGLIESELFGHEKGSFTGALAKKIGKFELADGGTIFLDELGDLPLDAQAKLLRVLQEREFERVGGNETIKVDVRIIAATNRNLENAVSQGKFRTDLYYRLNVFPIEIPSLCQRREDIPELAFYFLNRYSKKLGKNIKNINDSNLKKLKEYDWPGNIRELENVIERAVIMTMGSDLYINDNMLKLSEKLNIGHDNSTRMEDIEREHIIKILNQTDWKVHGKDGAAIILDINPSTLRTRMAKLGIKKKSVLI